KCTTAHRERFSPAHTLKRSRLPARACSFPNLHSSACAHRSPFHTRAPQCGDDIAIARPQTALRVLRVQFALAICDSNRLVTLARAERRAPQAAKAQAKQE